MAKHDFTGVFIPAHIWLSKELLPAEKMILAEVEALSKRTGWCEAGRQHFAEWLQCDPTNVSHYVTKLEGKGFLIVARMPGGPSKMQVVPSRFYVDEVVNGVHGGSERGSRGVVNGVHGGSERGSPEIKDKYNYKIQLKENSAAAPLFGPFKKVGEIKIPETISLETLKKEKPSPGAGGDVTPGRSTGGAVRLSIVDPELPGVRIEEEIQPKTQPEKTGRSKAKNPRSGTTDEIDLAMRVIEHLNQSAGRSFRINAGENAKGIIARHREGFTETQMQKVIDLKIRQWGNDAHMRGNINPVTLFRPANFERYLVEAELPPMQHQTTRSSIQTFTGSNYNEKQAF